MFFSKVAESWPVTLLKSEQLQKFLSWVSILGAEHLHGKGHLEISALASGHQRRHWQWIAKKFFFLRSFYFCISKFLMRKTSMVKSFSSTLAYLPGSFSCCLEQLLSRKPVTTCFWRKELHSRRYIRSFKNTHGWKLDFARL